MHLCHILNAKKNSTDISLGINSITDYLVITLAQVRFSAFCFQMEMMTLKRPLKYEQTSGYNRCTFPEGEQAIKHQLFNSGAK